MSNSNHYKNLPGFSEAEVGFLAGNEYININPSFSMDELPLMSGTIGPFVSGREISVPLWLALAIKKRGKCRISRPSWLTIEYLTEQINLEKAGSSYQPLPYYISEIGHMLLQYVDDIPDAQEIRTLLRDIEDIRYLKLSKDLKSLLNHVGGVQLNNLTAMEVNKMRRFINTNLGILYKNFSTSQPSEEEEEEEGQ